MPPSSDTAHLTPKVPFAPALKAWESYLYDQGRSPNTVKAFLSDVSLLAHFLPPDQKIGAITTNDLNRFFGWMEKERAVPCSPKTLARRITSVKSLFRWLHQFGVLTLDPAEKVAQRSAISPLPQVLTEDEAAAALAVPVGTVKSRLSRARAAMRLSLQNFSDLLPSAYQTFQPVPA
jgi:integrase/recombinase XerD